MNQTYTISSTEDYLSSEIEFYVNTKPNKSTIENLTSSLCTNAKVTFDQEKVIASVIDSSDPIEAKITGKQVHFDKLIFSIN